MIDYNPFILIRKNSLKKSVVFLENEKEIDLLYSKLITAEEHLENVNSLLIENIDTKLLSNSQLNLIELRRNLFNERYAKLSKTIENIGDIEIKNATLNLLKIWKKYIELEKMVDVLYDQTLLLSRDTMRNIMKENNTICNDILKLNPNIYNKLSEYIEIPTVEHKNKIRKLDTTLYKVISRSALKTSPFSDITRVGRVEVTEDSNLDNNHEQYWKACNINFTFLNRLIFYYLKKERKFYELINYSIPPLSIKLENEQSIVSFVALKDDERSDKIFETSESIVNLKVPKKLALFLKENSVNYQVTFERIKELFENQINDDQLLELIKRYVQIGLLVPAIGFEQKSTIHFIEEIENVSKKYLNEVAVSEVLDILKFLKEKMKSFEKEENLLKKYDLYMETDFFLRKLNDKTGIKIKSNNLFYEDGLINTTNYLSKNQVENILPDMELIQKLSLLFDVSIRFQLEMGARLYNGSKRNLDSSFFSTLFEVSKLITPYWYNPIHVPTEEIKSEEIKYLDELKVQFINEIKIMADQQSNIDIKKIVIKYCEKIPQNLLKDTDFSSTFFVQFNNSKAIVNAIYDGHEKYKARFMNYFREQLEQNLTYKEFVQSYYNNQGYHEYTDNFGFNGNVKSYNLNNEIVTIGTGRKRFSHNSTKVKKVEDLEIIINHKIKKIKFYDGAGSPIKIVFRGSLIPTALPGYISSLLQLFSSGRMTFKFSDFIEGTEKPRVTLGNIVLSRSKKDLKRYTEIFKRMEKESNLEWYKRVNKYFKYQKMNPYFFVTSRRDFTSENKEMFDFKPFFVAINNPISLKVFEKDILLKYSENEYKNLFIEEFLSDDSDYATEYDLEVFKKEGV